MDNGDFGIFDKSSHLAMYYCLKCIWLFRSIELLSLSYFQNLGVQLYQPCKIGNSPHLFESCFCYPVRYIKWKLNGMMLDVAYEL